jgi:hypothetical protein
VVEVVVAESLAGMLGLDTADAACPGVIAARTATAPVVSAAAAAVAWVILTMRRLASLRWVLDEPERVVCGASSGGVGAMPGIRSSGSKMTVW